MNLTFLDASTLTRGDVDLAVLEEFGTLTLHDITSPEETPARCENQDVLITNKVVLDADLIGSLPNLKLILVSATGVNVVDLEAAKARGIPVCNVAGYSTPSVAQHATALLLTLATNVNRYNAERNLWPESPIFTRLDHPVVELAGKTCGIVGLGDIGTNFASIAEALGMKVQIFARPGSANANRPELSRVDAETFFATSDVISLHCPLTDDNLHFINRETLAQCKPSAFLINVSRGPLVDEDALAEALRGDQIAGAGLDVLSLEPPAPSNPLLTDDLREKNLVVSPHSAWLSRESRQRLLDGVVGNLRSFLEGAPTNRVA